MRRIIFSDHSVIVKKTKCLTLYRNGFLSPTQMGSLSVYNSVTKISRLGTFNYYCTCCLYGAGRNDFDGENPIRGPCWKGWALKIETFLGPEMGPWTKRVPFQGPKKTNSVCSLFICIYLFGQTNKEVRFGGGCLQQILGTIIYKSSCQSL